MAKQRNCEIQDYGNIESLEFEIPDRGCVIEVLGRCGSGKSVALNGVGSLGGGKLEYLKRDGSDKAVIRGLEAEVSLRRSTVRKGKIVCELLDKQSDIGDLVNPRIKDPDAASAKQIKALLRLSGAVIDESAFQLCKAAIDIEGITDPVLMAAKAKRQYEVMARKSEDNATTQQAYYDAAVGATKDLDMKSESDSDTLQAAMEVSMRAEASIQALFSQATEQRGAHEQAKVKLAAVRENYSGPTSHEAYEVAMGASKSLDAAYEQLNTAKELHAAAARLNESSQESFNIAQEHDRVIDELTDIFEDVTIARPLDNDIKNASQAVHDARLAVENGALVRDAKEKLEEAEKCKSGAKSCRGHAESYRKAAAGCDDVLSNSIDCEQLSVKNGHLVTESEPYNRLSEGLRWKLAIEIACSHAPDGQSLLVIPQEEYQATDPGIRQMLRKLAAEKNIVVLAGLATSGDLRVEELEAVEA